MEATPSLKSRHLFKLRRRRFQPFVQRVRVKSPTVLRPAFHAAFVAFADTVEFARISNREGAQHHRMNQSENGRGAADPQSQREYSGRGKNRRPPELPHRVAKIAERVLHYKPPDFITAMSCCRFQ